MYASSFFPTFVVVPTWTPTLSLLETPLAVAVSTFQRLLPLHVNPIWLFSVAVLPFEFSSTEVERTMPKSELS